MPDYSYAYLTIALVYIAFSGVFFLLKKHYRFPMMVTGLVLSSAGPISEFFSVPEYWDPVLIFGFAVETPVRLWKFGIEDLIGTIGFAALSVALFEHFSRQPRPSENRWQWIPVIKISLLGLTGLVLIVIFFFVFGISGTTSSNLSMLILALIMLIFRPVYIKAAFLTAVSSALLYWMVLVFIIIPLYPGIFNHMWAPEGRMGILILGVPLEEVIWAFLGALFCGPVFRITHERKTTPNQTTFDVQQKRVP